MFGYVRPYKPELRFKEFDAYKAVYCSLCKEIGRRYGRVLRLTLLEFALSCFLIRVIPSVHSMLLYYIRDWKHLPSEWNVM